VRFGLVLLVVTVIGFGLCQLLIQKMVDDYSVQLGEWMKNNVNPCITLTIETGKPPWRFSDAVGYTGPNILLRDINDEYPCEKGEHNVTLYLYDDYYFIPIYLEHKNIQFVGGVTGFSIRSNFDYHFFLNLFSIIGLISGVSFSLLLVWKGLTQY